MDGYALFGSEVSGSQCPGKAYADYEDYLNTTYERLCMENSEYLQHCSFPWFPGNSTYHDSCTHTERRYSDPSVSWVLTAAIIVFFMKAGFMLLEIAFAMTPRERRIVVIYKYIDAFASALGFFLIGYSISYYKSPQCIKKKFFDITDPVLWFFKFTFASNAATILGGCLVTNTYKLRIPAVFISAFVISGIAHPVVALFIWSDSCSSYSPYRFCEHLNCTVKCYFGSKAYFLDFAGGGAVHLLGGTAGLMVCLFAKLQKWRDNRKLLESNMAYQIQVENDDESREPEPAPKGFWDWMYPQMAGNESVEMAALGVLILWFAWFAFNCGSTESVESGQQYGLYHAVPSRIAINMILSCAAGGTLAVVIGCWAQLRYRTDSVNANEIANGILSCLVAITASCPFVTYWAACLIGIIAVIFYHLGCYAEYKLGIEDTARVVPVHGVCGLWSLLAVAVFVQEYDPQSLCNVHAAFEGLCYCNMRLPCLEWTERFGAQIIGALVILALGLSTGIVYGILYIIPIQPFVNVIAKVTFLNRKLHGRELNKLKFHGGFLLTSPLDDFTMPAVHENLFDDLTTPEIPSTPIISTQNVEPGGYGTMNPTPSSLGYSSGAELRQLPNIGSSNSSQPSSSNTSSQQGTSTISSSQPLLGRPGQSRAATRRNVRNEDSTV